MLLRALARRLPHRVRAPLARLRSRLFDTFSIRAFSHEGEDLVLRRMFPGKNSGYYVDVGAHHPRRFSNTYYFYRLGWTGINIEPNPDAVRAFRAERKRDTNVQCGVAERSGSLTYYRFDEPALNTFDDEIVKARLAIPPYKLVDRIEVPVEPLATVLEKHLPPGQAIDFLSIDVEGLDLTVLKSNDWSRFRPECVLAEALDTSLEEIIGGEMYLFMKSKGYDLVAKTISTLFFHRSAPQPQTRDEPA